MATGPATFPPSAIGDDIAPNYPNDCSDDRAGATSDATDSMATGTAVQSAGDDPQRHSAGANIAMCDGSVRFLTNDVPQATFYYMGSRNDKQTWSF